VKHDQSIGNFEQWSPTVLPKVKKQVKANSILKTSNYNGIFVLLISIGLTERSDYYLEPFWMLIICENNAFLCYCKRNGHKKITRLYTI
jgi:hypothetical protein